MALILIIDDEEFARDSLSERVRRLGYEALEASTLQEGLQLLQKENIDLVLLDVNLPDGNGLESLPAIKQADSSPEVIIITAVGSAQGAALAIENGAWDYVTKPFTREEITLQVNRAIEYRRAKRRSTATVVLDTSELVGKSPTFKRCINQIAKCAGGDANVLILGETGTGKELFARAVHDNCRASEGRYVIVDCASMPETLMASVLFGHVKGAFTGADQSKNGLIKQADGGTLFLDEVGELPLSMQASLLRVLQEKVFRPVGSSVEIKSSFRLISATNRDLKTMVEEGKFRNDLFHRLQSLTITIPPLRDRREDIELLVQHYLQKLCRKHEIKTKALLPESLELLQEYTWPGNVRELIHVLERAILQEPDLPLLYPMFLPNEIRIEYAGKHLPEEPEKASHASGQETYLLESIHSVLYSLDEPLPELKQFREKAFSELERHYLKSLLRRTEGNIEKAITSSGLSKSRFYTLLKKYNLQKKVYD